jgi:uncharacterized protein involved in exopolysaccharide biosynthesis
MDGLSLADFVAIVRKYRRLVVAFPLVIGVLTAVVSLLLPPVYTATATILPPQQTQSSASLMLSQALAGGAGGNGLLASSLGLRNPNELYVGMLKSRTIADRLIERFELRKQYRKDLLEDARTELEGRTAIRSGKDGIIVIQAQDEDAARAAALANAYVEELDRLTTTVAVTEAARRRLFFERQLQTARAGLAQAEMELKDTQEATGIIRPDEQGRAMFEAIAELRGRAAAKEVELSVMQTFATEQNPAYERLREELAGIRSQLALLERRSGSRSKGSLFVPAGEVPQLTLEYMRRLRDLKYQETMFELLSKQYEVARLDEAKDASLVQVLDRATQPDRRSWPRRTLMVIVAVAAAAALGMLIALFSESRARKGLSPASSTRT